MASDTEPASAGPQTNGILHNHVNLQNRPSTPRDTGLPESSQITLPSTEVPPSPGAESVKTEINDDRPSASTIIPSSLTPPPSTQPAANATATRRPFSQSQSQQSNFCSPPATIQRAGDHRDVGSDYVPPEPLQVQEASADELRAMVRACTAEHQKLKMETAHYKLQFNLLSMQAEDDAKRAKVEHEMTRREVEALRTAEHSRQARREINNGSESIQAKYFDLKALHEDLIEENDALNSKVKSAKNVIQELQDRCEQLEDDRQMYINRIRENRERFHMLTSPGGMFHGVLTPRQENSTTPQARREQRQSVRGPEGEGREQRMSALLQVLSQENSAPSMPQKAYGTPRQSGGRHNRNSMSMSALPTTPSDNHRRGGHAALLPSVDLVPQTEPTRRYSNKQFAPAPTSPQPKRAGPRKSRESTISDSDNEELARQAMKSVTASHSQPKSQGGHSDSQEYVGSQASQVATEYLRRDPRQSFEIARSAPQSPAESAATVQAKLLSNLRGAAGADKRKFSGSQGATEEAKRTGVPPSPGKKRKVGLGIDFGQKA